MVTCWNEGTFHSWWLRWKKEKYIKYIKIIFKWRMKLNSKRKDIWLSVFIWGWFPREENKEEVKIAVQYIIKNICQTTWNPSDPSKWYDRKETWETERTKEIQHYFLHLNSASHTQRHEDHDNGPMDDWPCLKCKNTTQ